MLSRFLKIMVKLVRVWLDKVQSSRHTVETERVEYWKNMFALYMNMLETFTIHDYTADCSTHGTFITFLNEVGKNNNYVTIVLKMYVFFQLIFYVISSSYFGLKNLAMVIIMLGNDIEKLESKVKNPFNNI